MAVYQTGQRNIPTIVGPANSSAIVATSQTTTSTTYTDLATAGPSATLITGSRALVVVSGQLANGTLSAQAYMGYAVSGATTTSATDATAILTEQSASTNGINQDIKASCASVVTLNAGSNTFTAKYRVSSGTGTFSNREIIVINLA